MMREEGLAAKISSIHVNGWFGEYDKLAMTRLLFAERFGRSLEETGKEVLFVGDSPNDTSMFSFFENSVGVANVRRFAIPTPPRYVTSGEAGAGFEELVAYLLAVR